MGCEAIMAFCLRAALIHDPAHARLEPLSGGTSSDIWRIDIQDVLVVPLNAESSVEAAAIVAEVYRAAGVLMSERGLMRGVADEGGWWPEFGSNAHYPIVSAKDPVAEDDDVGMRAITAAVGESVQVIGDDYLVTSEERVARAAAQAASTAMLVKPNQAGTFSEALEAFEAARRTGWRSVVPARSGETEEVTIVHLAVGWGADQFKVGSFARSERVAKWNEAIGIEQALGSVDSLSGDGFVGRFALPGFGPLPVEVP